ncbi:hypothetical protein [Algimonas ampicilliniresistens]|uniref:hypothetical protein n=1 Tax=Algimonas ampicilliniresistens TaxID=1298735 RepID=UPI0024E04CF5|nr:hypothetical protein [Algimonas ampicilliniresistens]
MAQMTCTPAGRKLLRSVEHRSCLAPGAQSLFNIRAALAATKPRATRALNTGCAFRTFGGGGIHGGRIDVIANAMDHAFDLSECE